MNIIIIVNMRRLSLIVLLVLMFINSGNLSNSHGYLLKVWNALVTDRPPADAAEVPKSTGLTVAIEAPMSKCVGCTKKVKRVDSDNEYTIPDIERYSVTEQEFTALRIEYIKNQILRKLRLKEKPQVSISQIPLSFTENNNIIPKLYDEYMQNRISDDFYGKTTQAIVFPYEDPTRCIRKIRNPSACIPFQMPADILASDVKSAELWFYKEDDILDEHNQTFVISEVAHWDRERSFQKTKPIAIQETSKSVGWLKIDVAYVVKQWLTYQDSPIHAINVACKTCGMEIYKSPVSFQASQRPFLIIATHSEQSIQPRRPKRHTNCGPGVTECCRESLYVSFAEIGWNDWIIYPAGYNAYFCKGSCASAASITLSGSDHNHILHKVMYGSKRKSVQKLELKPCCSATQFQPLQLVFMHTNKTMTSKILSNMIVDSCGCN